MFHGELNFGLLTPNIKPKYKHKGDDFWTIFNFKKVKSEVEETEGENGKATPETTPKTTLKTAEKIIELMKKNPTITIETLCQECKLSRDGMNWNIRQLKSAGLIRRVGPNKGDHWEVIDQQP